MTDPPSRELHNNVSGVLRRVESGERPRVTVNERPVAELIPLSRRQQTMRWEEFERHFDDARADPGLTGDLAELLPDTTDDVAVT